MRTNHERHYSALLLVLLSALLAGCGQKGPLFLSVPPAKVTPLMSHPANGTAPAAATKTAPAAATTPARPPATSTP
jgi:predicted small lipoprotein YifL